MPEEEDFDRKSLVIFGTDLAAIPCFRSSFLYGAGGGAVGGLAAFLFTSRVRLSCHLGYGTFVATTLIYWVQCRYTYAQTKFSMAQIQEAYKIHTLKEGTAEAAAKKIEIGEA